MQSLRTMIVVTVLAAVGYGLYVSINKPKATPPSSAGAASAWSDAPQVELPELPGPPQVGGAMPAEPGIEVGAAAPVAVETETTAPPFDAPAAQFDDSGAPGDPAVAIPAAPDVSQAAHGDAPPFDSTATVPGAPPVDSGTWNGAAGAPPDAAPVNDPAAPAGAEPPIDFLTIMGGIQAMLDQNRLADAQLELSRWYDDPRFNAAEQAQVLALLDQLTGTVIYSTEHLLEAPYVAQAGDTLEQVAQRYQVPWQVLAKINGLADPQSPLSGATLKVLQGPFSAYVELSKYRLTLWLNGRYAGRFAIGLGPDLPAADGEYAVLSKVENPGYQGDGVAFDANDPQNPLGEYWLDLGNRLGIHGTSDPTGVGRTMPIGSISLAPAEAQDVFDMLVAGSRVMIRR